MTQRRHPQNFAVWNGRLHKKQKGPEDPAPLQKFLIIL